MSWVRRLWNTFRPRGMERDIERELSFHLAERADQLRAEGLGEDEARREARMKFGSVIVQAERTRDMNVSLFIDAFLRDVRYALRSLLRTPGFTVTVVLTLALGIGANTAVFSAVDAVLLKPLHFPEADRLVRLRQLREGTAESGIAPVRLQDWQRLNVTLDGITGYYMEDVSETSGDVPEHVRRAWVAPRFLEVWRVDPAIGRGFTAAEHRMGGQPAVLVSDRYWRVRLGGDPNVLGRRARIGSASIPIIGVMPPTFLFPDRDVDLWFPSPVDFKVAQSRKATWYTAIGRLKYGVTLEQARANLDAVQAGLGRQYPETDGKLRVEIVPLKETTIGSVRNSLWLLFAGVSVLLLITCTNIAGLLLARGTHRHQEISVRLALGASNLALVAQMLVETLLLSIAGAAIGLLLAAGAVAGLRVAAADLPRVDEIAIEWRILLYTLVSAVAVALLCGIVPALRAARVSTAGALNDAGRTQVSGRNSLQWLFVGAQVALSVVLLAAAGLLARSFYELSRVDLGFDPARVLTFRVSGSFAETADYARLVNRIDSTIDELGALPGVEAVATTLFLPGVPAAYEQTFALVEAKSDDERRLVAESRLVSAEYFATMKIPLVEGEMCRRQPFGAPTQLMVNRAFRSRYLSGWSSPIGLHLATGTNTADAGTIVGIVADARDHGIDRAPSPIVYPCFSAPHPTPRFLVRTRGDPVELAHTVRLKLKEREPLRSVYDIAPLEDRIGGAFAQNRLRTTVLVFFAVTALTLACVGLYGTLSYVVNLRRREVGLRLALGAVRKKLVRQFLVQAWRVVVIAIVTGLVLSSFFTRLLAGMLYGVSPSDPVVLATVVAIVLVVATVAALIPAMRAAAVEPMQVLREG
jgi:putative ABC transport system permease protein